jgi:stress-induced-phosphoprotein 1
MGETCGKPQNSILPCRSRVCPKGTIVYTSFPTQDSRHPLHRQLRQIQQNPRLADTALQDPRMITVMGVLLGVDMQGFGREEGSDELPPGMSQRTPTPPTSPPKASTPAPKPNAAEDVKMADPEPENDDEEAKAKKEAEVEKQKGSEAYKKRDFEVAAKSFGRAWEIWPKDITFLTNLSGPCQVYVVYLQMIQVRYIAVYMEQGEYDKSIETAEKAVEEGRSVSVV